MVEKLYFRKVWVAEISEVNGDFPGFSAKFKLRLGRTDGLSSHLLDYVNYCMLHEGYMPSGKKGMEDNALHKKRKDLGFKETDFEDLYSSDDWKVIEVDGKSIPILCPIFMSDKTIVFRPNYPLLDAR